MFVQAPVSMYVMSPLNCHFVVNGKLTRQILRRKKSSRSFFSSGSNVSPIEGWTKVLHSKSWIKIHDFLSICKHCMHMFPKIFFLVSIDRRCRSLARTGERKSVSVFCSMAMCVNCLWILKFRVFSIMCNKVSVFDPCARRSGSAEVNKKRALSFAFEMVRV